MNAITSAAGLVGQYWRRPTMWPAIWRMSCSYLDHRMRPAKVQERKEQLIRERARSEEWCAEHAIPFDELANHLPFEMVLRNPAEEFPDVFRSAHECVSRCPIKLGGAGNIPMLYSLASSLGAKQIVETGVAYGWSSLALLLAMKDRWDANLHSVDLPYLTMMNDEWVGVAVPSDLHPQWKLYRMADREGLPRAIRAAGVIDMAHYDSDKSPEGREFGYRAMWQALRPQGVLISDDIGDNLAFQRFSAEVRSKPVVVRQQDKYQGILVK